MAPITRAFVVTVGIVLVLAIFMFALRDWRGGEIGYVDLRVVNNTPRTVQIQPCWDLDCLNTAGLRARILRPRESVHVGGQWPNDVDQKIVVAIQRPGAKPWQFEGCLVTLFRSGQKWGDVRVSHLRPCFTGPEGGGAG